MLDTSCSAQQGIRQGCRHVTMGRHLAPGNDGAHQGTGIGHGKEVAVLRCGVPCQQPHIEEQRQLRLYELPCCVCVPVPCMREWDISTATSDCQPQTLAAVVLPQERSHRMMDEHEY